MISSLRGLLALALVAIGLAIVVLVVGVPASPVTDRSLLPRFVGAAETVRFSWTGKPDLTLEYQHQNWVAKDDPDLRFESATVNAALAAVRATWHRRADAAVAEPTRGGISVAGAEILVGRDVPGSAQTWLVVGKHALLVDTWVAHALLPTPFELRVRQPFEAAPVARAIRGSTVHLSGRYQFAPTERWITEAPVNELVSALVDLTIVSIEGMHPAPRGPSISINPRDAWERDTNQSMTEAGTCDGDRVRVETSHFGDGCVDAVAWHRALAAFEPLVRDDPSLVDTRLLPFPPEVLTFTFDLNKLGDTVRLDLTGRPKVETREVDRTGVPREDTQEVDLDRVHELLAALSTTGTIVPRPTEEPRIWLSARTRDDVSTMIHIFDNGVIARTRERFALRPTPEAFAMITRPAAALRDPVLWREDPTTITTVKLDGATYQRGAVIGEWTRTPAGKFDPALVDTLVETLARVRGPVAAPPAKVAHTLTVTFAPPTGAPVTHSLELASPSPGGCAARVDAKPVRLDLPVCTAVVALASSH